VKSWSKHVQPLVIACALGLAFGACTEQLDSGVACPALCPEVAAQLKDTTFFAIDLDTAVAAYPTSGEELRQFIASMGDTLQTRGVIRYDSLPSTFRHNNSVADTVIMSVDSAYIKLSIVTGDTAGAPTTIEAYDVDLGGPDDTDPTAVASAFTPSRLLGTRTIPADSMRDSVRIPIDPAKLLAKIQATAPANRLRVGIKVSGSGKSSFTALTSNANSAAQLLFRGQAGDTSVPLTTMFPYSKTPAEPFIAFNLADYLLVVQSPPPPPTNAIRVGGIPGSRAYLRFNIPASILDSSQIVRASLQLTQSPAPHSVFATDTLEVQPFTLLASGNVTDVSRALLLLDAFACPVSSDTLFPKDSAVRVFEIINVLKCWRGTTTTKTPRAIALVSGQEGLIPSVFDFFSIEAPLAVRPRLRLTYLPKREAGLP
jgi:hypothetical protein